MARGKFYVQLISQPNFNTTFIIPDSVPAFTTHVKLLPHPVPIGSALFALGPHATAALIGPFGTEDTVAVQINAHHPPYLVAHQLVPYTVSTSVPTAIPLKLFFTRFPPFIEAIVQRIQNYYSTYNHVENENYTASPPENKPVSTTTPMPTYTTIAPTLPADAGSQPENDQTDDTSAALSVTEPENNNR
jgi:hypothetical protein